MNEKYGLLVMHKKKRFLFKLSNKLFLIFDLYRQDIEFYEIKNDLPCESQSNECPSYDI